MKRISSGWTRFNKKVVPVIWFGVLGAILIAGLAGARGEADAMFFAGPAIMIVFGYVLLKLLVWDLADEVLDAGDHLVVRNRGLEDRISLTDVSEVEISTLVNPPRVTLRLEKPSRFGRVVAFSPEKHRGLNPLARNRIGKELVARVDQARRARR